MTDSIVEELMNEMCDPQWYSLWSS
jgi:hypothetical protein